MQYPQNNYIVLTRLDYIINIYLEYFKSIPAVSIAMAQGGDFIGGRDNDIDTSLGRRRKCMNTFICSTERPFKFVGRINEDVNTYTWYQGLGNLFLTIPMASILQRISQSNSGGMTELYLDNGTYIKSFYTVMYNPGSVRVSTINSRHKRLHHLIQWENTVPCIIPERFRKPDRVNASPA
jgi:hypothetical protein